MNVQKMSVYGGLKMSRLKRYMENIDNKTLELLLICAVNDPVVKQSKWYKFFMKNVNEFESQYPEIWDYCVLCEKVITGRGHNPYPVSKTGKCCDTCNLTKVIPKRMEVIQK